MKSNGERIDDAYNKLTDAISDMDKKYSQLKPGEVISDKDFKNLSDILKEVREVSEDKDIQKEYLSDIDKGVPADAEFCLVAVMSVVMALILSAFASMKYALFVL